MNMHMSATGHAAPEAIVAFIDGTVSPEVASHIQGCGVCAADAEVVRATQVQLIHKLYRFDCPDALRLGEYELGLVDQAERVSIATHALECTPCTADLQVLRGFLATEPTIPDSIGAHVRRVIATLLAPAPGMGLMGIRGAADTQMRQYQVDDVRVSLSTEQGALIGLLTFDERDVPRANAHLLPEHGSALVESVDELGNFEFDDVPAGVYTLEVHLPDEVIVVEQVAIA
jgi:hypothetical protein